MLDLRLFLHSGQKWFTFLIHNFLQIVKVFGTWNRPEELQIVSSLFLVTLPGEWRAWSPATCCLLYLYIFVLCSMCCEGLLLSPKGRNLKAPRTIRHENPGFCFSGTKTIILTEPSIFKQPVPIRRQKFRGGITLRMT